MQIYNCKNIPALKTALHLELTRSINVSGFDVPDDESTSYMIELICGKWTHTPISNFKNVFHKIALGETNIYGKKVSMQILNKMFEEEENRISIERETDHNNSKGFGSVEVAERISGRISDFFNVKK